MLCLVVCVTSVDIPMLVNNCSIGEVLALVHHSEFGAPSVSLYALSTYRVSRKHLSETVGHLLVRIWEGEEKRLGVVGAGEEHYLVPDGVEFPLLSGGAPGVVGTVEEVTNSLRSKV